MKIIKQLMVYSFLCIPLILYCMQQVPVKLTQDESCCEISLSVIQKSNTMYTELLKKPLNISAKEPIVVHNISLKGLGLFLQATQKTEITFPEFFNKLKREEQQELISVAGADKLNSPEITALLAQSYLLPEIVQKHIIPYLGQAEVKHYMQGAMIKHNIPQSDIDWSVFFQEYKTMLCSNGIYYEIPENFNAHETLYTTNIFELLKPINLNNANDIITHMRKQVDSCEYRVTTTISDTGLIGQIWRIKNGVEEKKEFPLRNHILTTICSQNGKYIIVCTKPNNQNILFSVDPLSDTIVENQFYLSNNLNRIVDVQFNNSSTALFILSCDEDMNESQLLIYDLKNNKEKLMHFNNLCFIAPAINHDSSRMILSHVCQGEVDTLSVWDIHSLQNPFQLKSFNITQLGCDIAQYYKEKYNSGVTESAYVFMVSYTHGSNNAVAQLHNGNMLFIDEITPDQIDITPSINSITYPFSKNIRNVCLLYIPDDNFLISYGGAYENNVGNISKEFPTVTIWDMQSKKMISAHQRLRLASAKEPIIVMSADGCSFIINLASGLWLDYRLYTDNGKATYDWISENKNLFSCYMLYRLYKAHKNQEEIIRYEHDAVDTFLKLLPRTIQKRIKHYLIIESKKSILETIEGYAQDIVHMCENVFDMGKSFFK